MGAKPPVIPGYSFVLSRWLTARKEEFMCEANARQIPKETNDYVKDASTSGNDYSNRCIESVNGVRNR